LARSFFFVLTSTLSDLDDFPKLDRLAGSVFESKEVSVFDVAIFAGALVAAFDVVAVLRGVAQAERALVDVDAVERAVGRLLVADEAFHALASRLHEKPVAGRTFLADRIFAAIFVFASEIRD